MKIELSIFILNGVLFQVNHLKLDIGVLSFQAKTLNYNYFRSIFTLHPKFSYPSYYVLILFCNRIKFN